MEVLWIPTNENRADQLTRVPTDWNKYAKALVPTDVVAACLSVVGPITLTQIREGQKMDPAIELLLLNWSVVSWSQFLSS